MPCCSHCLQLPPFGGHAGKLEDSTLSVPLSGGRTGTHEQNLKSGSVRS